MRSQSRPFPSFGVGYHHHHHSPSHHVLTTYLTVATFNHRSSLRPSHSFTVEMLFNTLLAFTLSFLCGTSIAIPVLDQWRDTRSEFCDPGRDAGSFACSWNSYDIVTCSPSGMVVPIEHCGRPSCHVVDDRLYQDYLDPEGIVHQMYDC